MNIHNALIVGGGIGGLCTAIALRQAGVAVDVVEIQPQWRVYGVGIIQQNNVVREMQRLGVLERYLDAAWPFDSVSVHTLSGQQLASFPRRAAGGRTVPGQRRYLPPGPAPRTLLHRAGAGGQADHWREH